MKRSLPVSLALAWLLCAGLTACSAVPMSLAGVATAAAPKVVSDATPGALPTRVPSRVYTPLPTSTPWQAQATAARAATSGSAVQVAAGATATPVAPTGLSPEAVGSATAAARPTATLPPAAGNPAPTAISGPALTITPATANVRAGPGTAYAIIGEAMQGQRFAVTGRVTVGDWWRVNFQGKAGWIAASVATASTEAAQAALVTEFPPTPVAAPVGQPVAAPAAPPAQGGPAGSGRIAFTSGRGNDSDVALLDVATGKTAIVIGSGRQPDLRFDGHILFNGIGGGYNNIFWVWPDGSQLKEISAHAEDQAPQWAPGRLSLAYTTTDGEGREKICVQWDMTSIVGDAVMRVEWIPHPNGTPNIVYGRFPTWLTDKRIAFSGCDAWLQASNCGIWTLDADQWRDFRPFPLTTNADDQPSDASGDQLVYASRPAGNWDIYIITTTPPARKIDPKPAPRQLTTDMAQDLGATFSPDGKRIAFMSNRGGGWGIWVMNVDGTNQRLLAAVPQGFGQGWESERLSWGP